MRYTLMVVLSVVALVAVSGRAEAIPPAAAPAPGSATAADDDKKGKGKKEEGEKESVKLPKAVAEAVKATFPGAKLVKAEKEDEDGETVYEVTLKYKAGTLEAALTPKGRVVKVELKGGGDDDTREQKGEHDDDKGKGKKKGEDDDTKGKGKKKGDRD